MRRAGRRRNGLPASLILRDGAAVAVAVVLVVELTGGMVAAEATSPRAGPGTGSAPPQRAATTMVAYAGLRLPVPAGWPVYHLDADPTRCVRLDRPAVYLGRPGPNQDCPARLVGRTETLHVEPLPRGPGGDVQAASHATHAEGEIRVTMPSAGVRVTATYGTHRAAMRRIVRAGRILPMARVAPPRRRAAEPRELGRAAARPRRVWYTGRGFDTCEAPSPRAMRAWRRAYRVANIYIGGPMRGCSNRNLSRYWVHSVRRMGYRLIPTYVGHQAPCTRFRHRFAPRHAFRIGWLSANDAVRRAKALGIGRRAPIYFDMEAYDNRKRWCTAAVLRFVHGWTRRMRKHHYTPGVYSSVASGIRDIGLARGINKPSSIWFAHWDKRPIISRDRYLSNSWWTGHRRIKQYRGPHRERHGGYTINIDSDAVDGRVY